MKGWDSTRVIWNSRNPFEEWCNREHPGVCLWTAYYNGWIITYLEGRSEMLREMEDEKE